MTQISADKGKAMEVAPLICPKCGADLDVPDGVEVFRCQYCGSKCQVKSSGSVRGLALLEAGVQKVAQHTERAANGIDELVAAQKSESVSRGDRDQGFRAGGSAGAGAVFSPSSCFSADSFSSSAGVRRKRFAGR